MSQSPTIHETKLTLRRTFDADRQRVFDAWTNPEHLQNWWRCDPGWSTEIAEIDLRVGGRYRLGMRDPGKDHPFVVSGVFQEVDVPNKLVYTWAWEEPTEHPGQSLVTIEFRESGKQTELLIVHEGFSELAHTEAHQDGWNACLAVFESYLQASAS